MVLTEIKLSHMIEVKIHTVLVQRRENSANVFADAFSIFIFPLIRVGKQSDSASDLDEVESNIE